MDTTQCRAGQFRHREFGPRGDGKTGIAIFGHCGKWAARNLSIQQCANGHMFFLGNEIISRVENRPREFGRWQTLGQLHVGSEGEPTCSVFSCFCV